jgi:putative endonuclease
LKNKHEVGNFWENIACEHLVSQDYEIIERNWRCGNFGELDIIAKKRIAQFEIILVVIEVKFRQDKSFAMPSEAVNRKKQYKIKKLTESYLFTHNLKDVNIRFDVIEIYWDACADRYILNHIKEAF